MQSALSEILRVCSPAVSQTVCIDTTTFFYLTWHICTHKFVKMVIWMQRSAMFSKKIFRFSCLPWQSISSQEAKTSRHRFHICGSNYVKYINAALLIKHRLVQLFQALQGSRADIMLYSSVRQHIHESNCVHIKESPAQRADLYIDMSPEGLICESGAVTL